MIFFAILWVVSLYFLIADKLQLEPRLAERGKWLFLGLSSASFALGGIFIMTIHSDQWIKGAVDTGFFGLCLLVAVRNLLQA